MVEGERNTTEQLLEGVNVPDLDTWEEVMKPGKPYLIQKANGKKFICFNSGSTWSGSGIKGLYAIPIIDKDVNFPFSIRLLDDNINWNTGYITGQSLQGGARGVGKISNKSKKRKNKRSKRYKRR